MANYKIEHYHCEPNEEVMEVTIKHVAGIHTADKIKLYTFEEVDYQAVAGVGTFSVGDKAIFIPAEALLPEGLIEELGCASYLKKKCIVRVAKMRGVQSDGLLISREVHSRHPDILKWNAPEVVDVRVVNGKRVTQPPKWHDSEYFHKYMRFCRIEQDKNKFRDGDTICFSEKIHGTNFRVGILRERLNFVSMRPGRWFFSRLRFNLGSLIGIVKQYLGITNPYRLHFGSRNVNMRDTSSDKPNVYCKFAKRYQQRLPKGYTFYGEIYGPGIQNMDYGLTEPAVKFFAASIDGKYLSPGDFMELADRHGLPRVNFYYMAYRSVRQLQEYANQPSEVYDGYDYREGVVVTGSHDTSKIAKVLSFKYLEKQGR